MNFKKSDNLVFLELENFCSAKDPVKRMKTRVTGWEKIFVNYIYNKRLLLRIYILKKNEVAQSCPTLCDPMDCSLPGSSIHGILQARILEWVAISFSRGSS